MAARISMDIFLTNKSMEKLAIEQTTQHTQYNIEICSSE